ncbi:MAG: C-terminal target protein [Bacteroidetes bacterium]|nr:C-terminal target protein [Bacteroidota bacterium]
MKLSLLISVCLALFSKGSFAQTLTVAPNPFVHSATLRFDLNTADTTSLYIVNIVGSTVRTFLHDTVLSPAQYSYTLSGNSMDAGVYVIVLQRNSQRTNTQLVKASDATAVKDINENTNWELYPNPAKDRIGFDKALIGSEISVFDMSGRNHVVAISQNQIDISSLPFGVYCLRIQNIDGILFRKFTKD